MSRFITIDRFVRDLASSLGDPEAKKTYVPLLRLTVSAMDELHLNIIPVVESKMITVGDNLTAPLREDAVRVLQVMKYVKVGNRDCVYPLGQLDSFSFRPDEMIVRPSNYWACDQSPSSSDGCNLTHKFFISGAPSDYWYLGHYYGEYYGYKETRFFGFWAYDDTYKRVVVQNGGCVSEGDTLIVQYEILPCEDEFKLIPREARQMLRYFVLSQHWENTNPSKANYLFTQFKRFLRTYKQSRFRKYSYQDWLDAITSAYSSTAR